MLRRRIWIFGFTAFVVVDALTIACEDSSSPSALAPAFEAGGPSLGDSSVRVSPDGSGPDAESDAATDASAVDAGPVLLTSGLQPSTLELTVDGQNLFWLEGPASGQERTVKMCSTNGCAAPVTLATEPASMWLRSVASDGTYVYYTTQETAGGGRVMRVAIATADGGVGTLVSDEGTKEQPWSVAIGPTGLYWVNWSLNGDLVRCDPEDCAGTRTVIGNAGKYSNAVRLTNDAVYWVGWGNPTSTAFAAKCALPDCTGGVTTLMYPGNNARQLRVAPPNFYWLDYDSTASNYAIKACPTTGCPDAASPPNISSDNTSRATQTLAVNSTGVYWIHANAIVSCPPGGCNGGAAPVHTTLPGTETPLLLAADETFLYVITQEGRLWRAPK